MSQCFSKLSRRFSGNVKIQLHISNYRSKFYLRKTRGVDSSIFAKRQKKIQLI